jgi:predicted Fe-Mo cluster-binding NifX family protein
MKIAVAADNNYVSAHFGHCEGFDVYTVEGKEIISKEFLPNPGHRPGFLPVFLKENGVEVIIAGGMGGAAQELFQNNNIKVLTGVQGLCEAAVSQYLEGSLKSTGSICHEHQHEGSCNP